MFLVLLGLTIDSIFTNCSVRLLLCKINFQYAFMLVLFL